MMRKPLFAVILILAVLLTACGSDEKKNNTKLEVPQETIVIEVTSANTTGKWTVISYELSPDKSETKSIQQVTYDGTVQDVPHTVHCIKNVSGTVLYSLSLSLEVGGDTVPLASVSLSPDVATSLTESKEMGDETTWITPKGAIDEVNVVSTFQLQHANGTVLNELGEIVKADFTFYTGACSISVDLVKRTYSNGQTSEQPNIAPTAVVIQTQTRTNTPEPTQGLRNPSVIYDEILNGSTASITVNTGEIHVVTFGPGKIEGKTFTGGPTIGTIVVLLPRSEPYLFTGLNPGNTWHGAFSADESQYTVLAQRYDQKMREKDSGNCINGDGCSTIDILIIGRNGFIDYP